MALAGGLALVALATILLLRYVESEAFRDAVLGAAWRALGADVRVAEMHVSVLSGVSLRQLSVGNPSGAPGELVRAEALVVRPRLLPLLRRRLEIREMRLEGPVVLVARGPHGQWSYERPPAAPDAAPAAPAPAAPVPPEAPARAPDAAGLDIVVPRLVLTRGALAVVDDRERRMLALDGIELATALSRVAGALSGAGQLSVATLRIADRIEARDLAGPLRFAGGSATVAPLRGRVLEGTLTGDAAVHLAGAPRYTLALELRDARAEALFRALGGRGVSGRLEGRARVAGTPAEATGEGHVEIRDGQLPDFPVLGAVAAALDLPLLRDLRFEEGAIDFVLAGDVLRTPTVRFVSRDVRIVGSGEIALRTGTLAHQLTLLVPARAVRRAPPEMRAAFSERPGGLMGVDFRVWGPHRALRTDLQDRVLRGVAESLLRKGLQQLFR